MNKIFFKLTLTVCLNLLFIIGCASQQDDESHSDDNSADMTQTNIQNSTSNILVRFKKRSGVTDEQQKLAEEELIDKVGAEKIKKLPFTGQDESQNFIIYVLKTDGTKASQQVIEELTNSGLVEYAEYDQQVQTND